MEFELPESIRVESKKADRVIFERTGSASSEFVTVDFEWRRWQLGNHPLKILNFVGTPYRGRNWKKEIVADAVGALLSGHQEEDEGTKKEPVLAALMEATNTDKPSEPLAEEHLVEVASNTSLPPSPIQPNSLPSTSHAFAWKRLEDGQISQDINAPTPEDLFQQAGFRPFRVLDPIQGFLCVPVQWSGGRWMEINRSAES